MRDDCIRDAVTRVAVVCPGRGSYTEKSLGSLPEGHPWVTWADEQRAALDLPPLADLDREPRFRAALHLRPANAAALIYVVSMIDATRAVADRRLVAVAGNSMGWYTALAVAGALSFEAGFRLVQEMALVQERHEVGGQVLYPLVDEDWRADPEAAALVRDALASSGGEALPSIHLGGFVVLAGTEAGIAHLLRALPQRRLGGTLYPFRLLRHGPYHTPWLAAVSDEARARLSDLSFQRPIATLIDGRGRQHSPWSADPDTLRDYTFGAQVTEPYDLSASLRVLLREFAPDRVVLPGPGNTLGGILGQVLVSEGWSGIRSKADFQAVQASDSPLVESVRR
jgi:[acyl-carrier-protein] S-malonyltransferase